METVDGKVKFDNHQTAHRHARQHFNASASSLEENGEPFAVDQSLQVPRNVFKEFFKLQSQVEKEGNMDYHAYANLLWNNMLGNAEAESDQQARSIFENAMITGLHSIDMKTIVYPHVTDNLEALIGVRGDEAKEVILWSTGDVAATGYQTAKIERSGIIKRYMKTLRDSAPESFRKQMGKTGYMVDDDKFERLIDHIGQISHDEERIKLVIIEDSINNFSKVENALKAQYGEDFMGRVSLTKVWVAYSREGQDARKKAGESPEGAAEYDSKTKGLQVIDSFAELLDQERFGEAFKDAHVFIDFDGVIGDNIAMREEQARVIYQALIAGGRQKGIDTAQIESAIQDTLEVKE